MPGTSKDKIAVLCPKEEAEALRERFKSLKNVEFIPAITFADDWEAVANAVRMADLAAYVIFGSKHSVSLFFEKAKDLKIKNPLKNAKVFASGQATARELEKLGVEVAYAPGRGGLYEVYSRISEMERGSVIEISGSSTGKTDKWELAWENHCRIFTGIELQFAILNGISPYLYVHKSRRELPFISFAGAGA